jgi:hypothetical protein
MLSLAVNSPIEAALGFGSQVLRGLVARQLCHARMNRNICNTNI